MHTYFVQAIRVGMMGGDEEFYLVTSPNEDGALAACGIGGKEEESFGFIKEVRLDELKEKGKLHLHSVKY